MKLLEDTPSTRPYFIRALHEWCVENGFTPFIVVRVNDSVQVPMEFVQNNEIILNISFDATSMLHIGNEFIEFKGRFGGVSRDIVVPVAYVSAIYARENGQGMAFVVHENLIKEVGDDAFPATPLDALSALPSLADAASSSSTQSGAVKRPVLTRIK